MGLKLRAAYILLAISIVILAIGIILIVNHSTPDRTAETPAITILVPQTLVVPAGNDQRLYFDISRSGVLRGTVEVTSGGSISYYLYKEPSAQAVEEGYGVMSNFEVPLDTGRYYLEVSAAPASASDPSYPWRNSEDSEDSEDRIVNVYLEFEG